MAIQHNSLTEADLHEPKGVSTAGIGTVYRATGGGTGQWVYLRSVLSMGALDVRTASSRTYLTVPQNMLLTGVSGVLDGPITPTGTSVTVVLRNPANAVLATLVFNKADSVAGTVKQDVLAFSLNAGSYIFAEVQGDLSAADAKVFLSLGGEVR